MKQEPPAKPQNISDYDRHSVYSQFHSLIYFAAVAIWLILHILFPEGWSVFWVMVFWGMAVLIHHLTVKCMNIDDKWVDERAADIGYNATDLGHIEAIRKGFDNRASNIANKFFGENDDASKNDKK